MKATQINVNSIIEHFVNLHISLHGRDVCFESILKDCMNEINSEAVDTIKELIYDKLKDTY